MFGQPRRVKITEFSLENFSQMERQGEDPEISKLLVKLAEMEEETMKHKEEIKELKEFNEVAKLLLKRQAQLSLDVIEILTEHP